MTVTLVVLYTRPGDPEAFDRHYLDVHAPLVDRVPGLLGWDHARLSGPADGGDLPWYRVRRDRTDRLTAKDARRTAPPGRTLGTWCTGVRGYGSDQRRSTAVPTVRLAGGAGPRRPVGVVGLFDATTPGGACGPSGAGGCPPRAGRPGAGRR
jgi:hypothetical protein